MSSSTTAPGTQRPSDRAVADPIARAAESLEATYVGDPVLVPDRALLRREIELIGDRVRAVLRGKPVGPPPGSAGLDRLRLLRALRRDVLREWPAEDPSLLPTMLAFEAVEHSMVAWGDGTGLGEAIGPFPRSLLREVAHLLRSPLGSIVMLADTLASGKEPVTESQRRKLDIIHRAALAMAATAGDILALVGEEEGLSAVETLRVDAMVGSVADLIRPVTEARGCRLEVGTDVDAPRAGPAGAIARALLGLALQAALHARDGSVTLSAEVGRGDSVLFSVSASGRAPETSTPVDELFRVFRIDRDSSSFTISQAGLGVAAARTLIERVGSSLEAKSHDDGAVEFAFSVALPRVEG